MEIIDLCKSYGELTVLDSVSLNITEGDRIMLQGPSGRGKTTLLGIIMGLKSPDSGEIRGVPERITAVFQDDRLPPELSVFSCIKYTSPRGVSKAVIVSHIERLGLSDKTDMPVKKLSGGERRRVSIIQAMLSDFDAVFLDEPFTGLDPAAKKLTAEYINEYTAEKTLIAVSHDPSDAELLGAGIVSL